MARHPGRPHFLDYARHILEDFTPLAGDRSYGEDQAVVAGLARFRGRPIAFIGQDFEPRPSPAVCSWCDYRLICPAAES